MFFEKHKITESAPFRYFSAKFDVKLWDFDWYWSYIPHLVVLGVKKLSANMKKCVEMRLRTSHKSNKHGFYQKDSKSSAIFTQVWKYANNGKHEIPLFTPELVKINHSVIWTIDCMWKIRLKHFPSSEQQVAPINTMIVEKSVMIVTVTTLIRTMPARSILPFIILPCVPIRLSKISTKKSFSKFIVF